MTPHIRQLLAQPDCVRCGSKCYERRTKEGTQQMCLWCKSILRAHETQHGNLHVRTWTREPIL
jgi:hypothetical protein